jgi:diaminopimelate decarboxylase
VELGLKKLHLSQEELKTDIAFLLDAGLTEEQIFFAINYVAREFFNEAYTKGLEYAVVTNMREILRYYELAKVKQAQVSQEEGDSKYDSRNVNKAKDTPSWFRKSFNLDLFK